MSVHDNNARATGTATVTVGCKLPHGLICELFEARTIKEVTMGGSREVEQYFPTGQRFALNGPGHAQNEGPRCLVRNGFAITRGIPKDFWDKWMAANKTLPAVINGLIIAQANPQAVADAAKDRRAQKTGQERADPNNLPTLDPRMRLKTSEDQKAKIIEDSEEE